MERGSVSEGMEWLSKHRGILVGVLFVSVLYLCGMQSWEAVVGCSLVYIGSLFGTLYYASCSRLNEIKMDFSNFYCMWERFTVVNEGLSEDGTSRAKPQVRTGSPEVDKVIEEIVDLVERDFLRPWYLTISLDERVNFDYRKLLSAVVANLVAHTKTVDWTPLVTNHIVDDFATHIRLFRKAREKLLLVPDKDQDVETAFFDLEADLERTICRDLVSTSDDYERAYLRDLSEVVLYLLLPHEDFNSRPLRMLLVQFLVNRVLFPAIRLVSEPDTINENLIYLLANIPVEPDFLLQIIRMSDARDELEAVKRCVSKELALQRSKDTGGQDDFVVKQRLGSLVYVERLVDTRIQYVSFASNNKRPVDSPADQTMSQSNLSANYKLTLGVILNNHVALSYFMDFLEGVEGGQALIYLYLAIEGFKASSENILSNSHRTKDVDAAETVREAATALLETYLPEGSSTAAMFESSVLKKLRVTVQGGECSPAWFDVLHDRVLSRLKEDQYYQSFIQSGVYMKLLAELDLLKAEITSMDANESDVCGDEEYFYDNEPVLAAHIVKVAQRRDGSSQYAVYDIEVSRVAADDSSVLSSWHVYRRYSDFYALRTAIEDKFPTLADVRFPGKRTFNNLDHDFLEKRRRALNAYLKHLLFPDVLKSSPGLQQIMITFLSKGGRKGRKIDLVTPILSGVRSVGNAVVAMPDMMVDGVRNVFGGNTRPADADGRVAAPLLSSDSALSSENIPLRIMLLLMDEVFGLRQRNQWFRRRLIAFLQNLIRATFGSSINKKIVDFFGFLTSAEQVSVYLRALKDHFWSFEKKAPTPDSGTPTGERTDEIQVRSKVVGRMKLLAAIPDELRILIGNETCRRGVFTMFDTFQNDRLNRRFCYVLLERVLVTLFPNNNIDEIILKLHSKSPRCQIVD